MDVMSETDLGMTMPHNLCRHHHGRIRGDLAVQLQSSCLRHRHNLDLVVEVEECIHLDMTDHSSLPQSLTVHMCEW